MINIAELLKFFSNIYLWSPLCGECILENVTSNGDIVVTDKQNLSYSFDKYGRFVTTGACALFPNKIIRDWNYFNAPYIVIPECATLADRADAIKCFTELGGKEPNKDLRNDKIWYLSRLDNIIKDESLVSKEGKYILKTGSSIKTIAKPVGYITEKSKRDAQEWLKSHSCGPIFINKRVLLPSSFSYIISGSGIGEIIEVRCNKCGKTHDITDISIW